MIPLTLHLLFMNEHLPVDGESDFASIDAVLDLYAVLLLSDFLVHARSCNSCLPIFTLFHIIEDFGFERPLIALL